MKKEFLEPIIDIVNFCENVVLTGSQEGKEKGDINTEYDGLGW